MLDEVEEEYDGALGKGLVGWDKAVTSWAGGGCLNGELER